MVDFSVTKTQHEHITANACLIDLNELEVVQAEDTDVGTTVALVADLEPAGQLRLQSTYAQGHILRANPVDGSGGLRIDHISARYGVVNLPASFTLVPILPHRQHSVEERTRIEQRLEEQRYGRDRADQPAPIPVLPPVVFMKRADGHTRLRYSVEILTVNGEKYVKVDETHFLYAINVDYLETGDNMTVRRAPYRHWQPDRRAGRPEILFVLYPEGKYAYTAENGRRKKAPHEFRPQCDNFGRVVLNALDRPLKFSNVMPMQVSTEIDGWEMEAVCRLDPDICHQDFIDRMLPNEALDGKVRPTKGTLNHRRRRDRMKMRVLPWPLPRQLTYSDQQVVKELRQWQIENNTTMGLRDLCKEETEMQEAIMYGGHFERSGANNALTDRSRLEQMKANLGLVRTKFDEGSEEVRTVQDRITSLQEKMGVAVGAA